MTGDITRRIADTVRKHLTCDCGEWAENMDETCAHVAEEIVKELERVRARTEEQR